jgi:hypothetical protein
MSKNHYDGFREMVGASKSLSVNIGIFRSMLRRRGPWKHGSRRKYHDELLYDIIMAKRSSLRLDVLVKHQGQA